MKKLFFSLLVVFVCNAVAIDNGNRRCVVKNAFTGDSYGNLGYNTQGVPTIGNVGNSELLTNLIDIVGQDSFVLCKNSEDFIKVDRGIVTQFNREAFARGNSSWQTLFVIPN